MKKTWIIIAVLVIIVVAILWVFSIENKPTQQATSQNATPSQPVATSTNIGTTTSNPVAATSSASAQVGPFTVVLNCHDIVPGALVAEDSVYVYKGNSLIQTITPQRGSTMQSCSSPEVQGLPGQDLGSGNSLYFMIDISHGQSVTYSQYWILNSSTQQFYCPTGNACILQD